MLCPGQVSAPLTAEPLPPDGFTQEDFTDAMVKAFGPDLGVDVVRWLLAQWRPWARDQAERAAGAKAFCDALAAKAAPP